MIDYEFIEQCVLLGQALVWKLGGVVVVVDSWANPSSSSATTGKSESFSQMDDVDKDLRKMTYLVHG